MAKMFQGSSPLTQPMPINQRPLQSTINPTIALSCGRSLSKMLAAETRVDTIYQLSQQQAQLLQLHFPFRRREFIRHIRLEVSYF